MKNSNLIARYLQGKPPQPKQRLQFPVLPQQRKHFYRASQQKVVIGHDNNESFRRSARRDNNLDVSDIDGARPKISIRSRSERHVTEASSYGNAEYQDQLDIFAKKGLHKRDLSMKQLERMQSEHISSNNNGFGGLGALESRKQQLRNARQFSKHLKTQPSNADNPRETLDKYRIVDAGRQKRSILNNPTYLSSLFFA